jgi:hypothetical protein
VLIRLSIRLPNCSTNSLCIINLIQNQGDYNKYMMRCELCKKITIDSLPYPQRPGQNAKHRHVDNFMALAKSASSCNLCHIFMASLIYKTASVHDTEQLQRSKEPIFIMRAESYVKVFAGTPGQWVASSYWNYSEEFKSMPGNMRRKDLPSEYCFFLPSQRLSTSHIS